MKNLALFFTFCLLALVLWQWGQPKSEMLSFDSQWRVYEKGQTETDKKLIMRTPTDEEKSFLGSRMPSSQESSESPANASEQKAAERQTYKGRRLVGALKAKSKRLQALNESNPDWHELFAEEMMRFQNSETKMFVKHQEALVLAQGQSYRLVEEVTVSYQKENGEVTAFKAWVDAQSGQLLNTWDRSIVHNYRQKPLTFSLQDAEAL